MNKWERKYNRRQRKKLRRGEFQELGFEVTAMPAGAITPEAREAMIDDFIEHAIEANGMLFAGGFNADFWGFVVIDAPRGSVTDEHREIVRAWLVKRSEITDLKVGPLIDANY